VPKSDQQRIEDLVADLARTLTKRQRLVAQLRDATNVRETTLAAKTPDLDTVRRQLESVAAAQRVLLDRLVTLVPPGHAADL
jgi:hypothetical protein